MNRTDSKKRRLNIVDYILIVIIVLGIAGAGWFVLEGKLFNSGEERYIEYTIELSTVKNIHEGKIRVGDTVTESVRNVKLGQVMDVKYENASIATTNMEGDENGENKGRMSITEYPDHKRVRIRIRSKCELQTSGEYTVEGMAVAVGAFINFRTPEFVTSGYCIEIHETALGTPDNKSNDGGMING